MASDRPPEAPLEVTFRRIKMFFYCNFSTKTLANCNKAAIKKSSAHHRNCSSREYAYSRLLYSNLAVSLITTHSDLDFVNIMQLSSCTQDHKEMITCLIV